MAWWKVYEDHIPGRATVVHFMVDRPEDMSEPSDAAKAAGEGSTATLPGCEASWTKDASGNWRKYKAR